MNRQPYQFPPTPGLTLTDIVLFQDTAGGIVYKGTVLEIINFFTSYGGGGSMLFGLMSDLKATTILFHKTILYNTIGDVNIPEDPGQWYFDSSATAPDNGRSILIPNIIVFPAPGRLIQRQ